MPHPPTREAALLLAVLAAAGLLLAARQVHREYYRTHPAPPERPPLAEPYTYGPHELNVFMLQLLGWYDTAGQRDAHRVLLFGTAVGAVLLWLGGGWAARRLQWVDWSASPWVVWPLRVLVGATTGWAVWRYAHHLANWWACLTALAFVRWAAHASPSLRRKWPNRGLGLLVYLFLGVLLVPAAWMRVDQSWRPWNDIETIEAHFTLLLSPGDRLAAGQRLFDEVKPGYGLTVPVLTAAYQKLGGRLTLLDYHKLIAILQAVFVLAAAAAYFRHAGKKWIVAAFPVAFLAVHYHFYQLAIKCGAPNHTAMRSLLVPVTFLLLSWVKFRTPKWAGWAAGVLAGLNFFYCFDIGIALSVTLIAFLVLRFPADSPRRFAPHFFGLGWRFAAGTAAVGVLAAGLTWAVCGQLPSAEGCAEFVKVIWIAIGSGYAGVTAEKASPLAVLMGGHAVVAVLTAFGRRARGVVSVRGAVSGAAGVGLLIWLVYYANRPDPIYLWSGFVLYGFLLVDLVRAAYALRWRFVGPAAVATAALSLVVVPAFHADLPEQWGLYREGWKVSQHPPAESDMRRMQGLYFPPDARADWVRRKADFVREKAKSGTVYYLTLDSYLIPKESGVWSATGVGEPLWESVTRANVDRLLRPIFTTCPPEVYLDSAESLPEHGNPRDQTTYPPRAGTREFFNYLRLRMSEHYRHARTEEGWEVWVPHTAGG